MQNGYYVIKCIYGAAYDISVAKDSSGFCKRHVVPAEMHSVCGYLSSKADIIVNYERRVMMPAHPLNNQGCFLHD